MLILTAPMTIGVPTVRRFLIMGNTISYSKERVLLSSCIVWPNTFADKFTTPKKIKPIEIIIHISCMVLLSLVTCLENDICYNVLIL